MGVNDYIETPTYIRIWPSDGYTTGPNQSEHWCIDGADANGNCTEACWTHWDNKHLTRLEAIRHAPDFMADHGWEHLPLIDQLFDAQIFRARREAEALLEDE